MPTKNGVNIKVKSVEYVALAGVADVITAKKVDIAVIGFKLNSGVKVVIWSLFNML